MAFALVLNRSRQVPAEESSAFGAVAERFRRAGELERAVALCRDGLRRFPDHLSARVTLGWALLDLGRYDEARAELETVLQRAPDNLAAIRGLAQLHDQSHTEEVGALHATWPPPEAEPEPRVPGTVQEPFAPADWQPIAPAADRAPVAAEAVGKLALWAPPQDVEGGACGQVPASDDETATLRSDSDNDAPEPAWLLEPPAERGSALAFDIQALEG